MKAHERGFTLIEVLIALVIFAIVAIGALAALGTTTASGFLEAFPTSFSTVRTARDYTTAAAYLQSFDDFVASKGKANATPGTYCIENASGACTTVNPLPSGLSGYPTPSSSPSQLNWTKLEVVIQQWGWNSASGQYSSATSSSDYLVYISSTLTWTFKERSRSVTVNRFFSCSSSSNPVACP